MTVVEPTVEALTEVLARRNECLIRAWNAFGPYPLPPSSVVESAEDLDDVAVWAGGDLCEQIVMLEALLAKAIEALTDIAASDDIDNALDPERNKRVARVALLSQRAVQ